MGAYRSATGSGRPGEGIQGAEPATKLGAEAAQRDAYWKLIRLAGQLDPEDAFPEFAKLLAEVNAPDAPEHLGALKVFKIPIEDPEEAKRVRGRLESEIAALDTLRNPGILKLLAHSAAEEFIVTEYHPNGTLGEHLSRYKGDALKALEAFQHLVEGVAVIHKQGAFHRDIKPVNIFIANDGRLVLGDFGIVYFEVAVRERLTKMQGERVGSRDWIAPWVDRPQRFEKVDGRLDIYALGKVLWSMVAGLQGFLREEWDRPENDLEKMFPNDLAVPLINGILAKCVVREEAQCLESAAKLQALVQDAITELRVGAEKPDSGPWRCRACGTGSYVAQNDHRIYGSSWWMDVKLYVCNQCKHVQMIQQKHG
jgi:serine/threonine protein kinase